MKAEDRRARVAKRVREHMASSMAMREPLDDQEQNWIYSHMTDFALALLQAEARPAQGWQSMESAPKDGTRVLGFVVRDELTWRLVIRTLDKWDGWYTDPGKHRVCPTHWMPLPDPPVQEP